MRQESLFDNNPEALARHSDPWTSHAAAASVDKIRESQQYIYSLFQRFGDMEDAKLAQAVRASPSPKGLHLSPSGIRTRRHELADLGLLKDSGQTVTLASGRRSIVWKIAR